MYYAPLTTVKKYLYPNQAAVNPMVEITASQIRTSKTRALKISQDKMWLFGQIAARILREKIEGLGN